uniref:Protein Iojap-related, mitochondrial n=1 Tax=Fagus sylvatica TaxID=28930 RepID=A0A2N9FS08_FAGSY
MMWAALRSGSRSSPSFSFLQPWKQGLNFTAFSSFTTNKAFLDLEEVEKVLSDVRADNVKVLPVPNHCDWADFMVVATGRSSWHVKNIAQALIYKAGRVIVHALDEKARDYYNLEGLWTTETSQKESDQVI